jgi:hypothetical protein
MCFDTTPKGGVVIMGTMLSVAIRVVQVEQWNCGWDGGDNLGNDGKGVPYGLQIKLASLLLLF